jgi:hypothetical protein
MDFLSDSWSLSSPTRSFSSIANEQHVFSDNLENDILDNTSVRLDYLWPQSPSMSDSTSTDLVTKFPSERHFDESNIVDYYLNDPKDSNQRNKKSRKSNFWTEDEKQELIQMAEEMIENGTFNFLSLGEQYSKIHPERSFRSAEAYARRLVEQGVLNCQKSERVRLGNTWTEHEKEQLIQMAHEMFEHGTFSLKALSEQYSIQNPKRTIFAIRAYARDLARQGKSPFFHLVKKRRFWTEHEKQQLIQMAEEMIENGTFSFTALSEQFLTQNPKRTFHATDEYARKLARQGIFKIPEINTRKRNIAFH